MIKLEKERNRFVTAYLIGLTGPFFCHLMMLAGISVAYDLETALRPVLLCVLAMAATGIWMTDEKRSGKLSLDAFLLILAFIWILGVFFLHRQFLESAQVVFLRGGIAWLAFYAFGFLLTEEEKRKGLSLLSLVWGGGMTALSMLGIWAVANKTGILDLGGNLTFGLVGGRLSLGIYTTSTSENILTAMLLITASMLYGKRTWARILAVAALAILTCAMALTDGRTGIIGAGILYGMLGMLCVFRAVPQKRLGGVVGGLAVAVLCVVVTYFGVQIIQRQFPGSYDRELNLREQILLPLLPGEKEEAAALQGEPAASQEGHTALQGEPAAPQKETNVLQGESAVLPEMGAVEATEQTAPELPTIAAEPTEALRVPEETVQQPDNGPTAQLPEDTAELSRQTVTHRKVEGTLSGRVNIWQSAWKSFAQSQRDVLLLGGTPFIDINAFFRENETGLPYQVDHLHNIFLQILLEWGIPGLVIAAAFLTLFAVAARKLLFARGLPMWQMFLPVPAVVILVAELVDVFTSFTNNNVALYVLFLFLGLSISGARSRN